jgi:hypothetical protein
LAEQCVREGKTKPKKLEEEEEGCRIAGYMEFGRVNGNFHIAMGEGVERKGQHIHTFLPEDTSRFNVSHVIHELRFGPVYDDNVKNQKPKSSMEKTSLNGVSKIVTKDNGKYMDFLFATSFFNGIITFIPFFLFLLIMNLRCFWNVSIFYQNCPYILQGSKNSKRN